MKSLLAAACALLATTALAAPKPDAALLKAATAQAPAVTATLKSLVEIETGTGDAEGMAAMGQYLAAALTARGGTIERVKPTGGVVGDIIVARWKGTGKGKLLLISHMDTVYQRGARAPFRLADSAAGPLAYGPGISDDKGGIATILHTLPLLTPRDYAELTVAINTDEERGSQGSGTIITELSKGMAAVLSFEPTGMPERLTRGTSATNTVIVTIKGKASHAGGAPEAGINALVEAAHIIASTKDLDRGQGNRRFNWTVVEQQRGVRNIIPDDVTLIGDLRTSNMAQYDEFKAELLDRLKTPSVPGAQVAAEVRMNRPPFTATAASNALIEEARAIYATFGKELAVTERGGGGTDAGYAALAGVPVIESLGLPGYGAHTTQAEYVFLEAVPRRLYLAASLIRRLGR